MNCVVSGSQANSGIAVKTVNQKADYSSLLEILLILGMKGVSFHTFP